MVHEIDRYERLPKGQVKGARIANRLDVKPGLTGLESVQDEPFLTTLRRKFGDPDERRGAVFSYSLRDRKRGIEFEVYSGSYGPSYARRREEVRAASPSDAPEARREVLQVLLEFERWLESD